MPDSSGPSCDVRAEDSSRPPHAISGSFFSFFSQPGPKGGAAEPTPRRSTSSISSFSVVIPGPEEGGARGSAGASFPQSDQVYPGPSGGGASGAGRGTAPRYRDLEELGEKAVSLLISLMMIFATLPPVPVMAAPAGWEGVSGYENTENVDGWIRLIAGHTSGTYTSEVLDAGEGNLWSGIEWVEEEPGLNLAGSAWVGDEPELLVDGSFRLGSSKGGPESLTAADGICEVVSEEEYVDGFVFVLSENMGENNGLYSLRWSHVLENVPEERDSYMLRIRGFISEDGESIGVYAWNHARSRWDLLGSMGAVEETLEIPFDWAALSAYVRGGRIQLMYVDKEPDLKQTAFSLDLCAVEWSYIRSSDVKLQVRFSSDGIGWSEWMGPDGTSLNYFISPPGHLSALPQWRYMQYRVYLSSSSPELSGSEGPAFSKVNPLVSARTTHENEENTEQVEEENGGLEKGQDGGIGGLDNIMVEHLSRGKVFARFIKLGGTDITVDFGASEHPIRRIKIKARHQLVGENISLELLDELPEGVPPLVPNYANGYVYAGNTGVYAYLDISPSFSDDSVDLVEVEFAVAQAWIRERGLSPSQMRLYHFGNSGWEELPTSLVGEDQLEAHFSAKSPGFSIYAIVYVTGQTVIEGGGRWVENAMGDDGVYENIYEKAYLGRIESMVAYSINTSTPQYRIWNGSSWGSQTAINAGAGNVRWVVLKYARNRNEAILGTVDSTTGSIQVRIWNGSSWGSAKTVGVVGTTNYVYRGFDIEYETDGDRAVVVYVPNTNATTLNYSVWDGSSWVVDNASIPLTLPTSGTIYWVEMAPNPRDNSSEIALVYLDSNSDIYGMVWNGSSWGNMGVTSAWETSAASATKKCVDVAYQQQSPYKAMFFWGNSTSTYHYYRLWDGSTLSGPTLLTMSAVASASTWVQLAPDPKSDNIMVGVQCDTGPELHTANWDGSAWGSQTEHDTAVEDANDPNFGIGWEVFPGHEGHAWLFYGDDSYLARKEWTGSSWGTATTTGDDTARVQVYTQLNSGVVFAVIQEDTQSTQDDLSEMRLTSGGGTWTSYIDFWTGATWANPQTQFHMIAHRRDNNFRMDVQHTITGIPSADNYILEVEYYTNGDSEPVSLYLYNFSSSIWENVGNLSVGGSAGSPYLFPYDLTGKGYISGGEVRVRYVQPDNDLTQTNLMVDFCRVKYAKKPGRPVLRSPENGWSVGAGQSVTFTWEND
ncbi:MAG: PGF-pre-PGF domain-containing protein, partial [Candidatus Hadarchaeales archaeon]